MNKYFCIFLEASGSSHVLIMCWNDCCSLRRWYGRERNVAFMQKNSLLAI